MTNRTLSGARLLSLVVLAVGLVAACANLLVTHDPSDLDVYRAGGRAVLDGHRLYDVRLGDLGFTYPPIAGLLFTGVAAIPRGVAIAAVSLSTLLALWVFVRCSAPGWWRSLSSRPSVLATAGVAALVASQPVRSTLRFGQVDVLLAALVLADLTGSHPRRWRGVGVGVAAAIKLTPGLFVVYLLLRGRYREAANAVGAFVLVSTFGAVLLPGDSLRFWTRELFGGSGVGNFASPNNNSLSGMLQRSLEPGVAHVVWLPLALLAAVAGLACAARMSRTGNEILALGIVGVTGCVVSPVSWDHHWVWAIPLLTGLAAAFARFSVPARVGVVVMGTVFVGRDLVPAGWSAHLPALHLVLVNAFVIAAVVAAGCVAASAVVTPADAPPSPRVRHPRQDADGIGDRVRVGTLASGPAGQHESAQLRGSALDR